TQTVIDMSFARDTALEAGRAGIAQDCGGAPCGLENPAADEIYRIHADRSANGFSRIAFTLGMAWKINDPRAIGAVYREPPGFNGAVTKQGSVEVMTAPRAGTVHELDGLATVGFVPAQSFELGARVGALAGLDAIAGVRWELTSRTEEYDVRMFG